MQDEGQNITHARSLWRGLRVSESKGEKSEKRLASSPEDGMRRVRGMSCAHVDHKIRGKSWDIRERGAGHSTMEEGLFANRD